MPANLRFATYDNDSRLYVVNPADRAGDPLDAHPAICERELQTTYRAGVTPSCLPVSRKCGREGDSCGPSLRNGEGMRHTLQLPDRQR